MPGNIIHSLVMNAKNSTVLALFQYFLDLIDLIDITQSKLVFAIKSIF